MDAVFWKPERRKVVGLQPHVTTATPTGSRDKISRRVTDEDSQGGGLQRLEEGSLEQGGQRGSLGDRTASLRQRLENAPGIVRTPEEGAIDTGRRSSQQSAACRRQPDPEHSSCQEADGGRRASRLTEQRPDRLCENDRHSKNGQACQRDETPPHEQVPRAPAYENRNLQHPVLHHRISEGQRHEEEGHHRGLPEPDAQGFDAHAAHPCVCLQNQHRAQTRQRTGHDDPDLAPDLRRPEGVHHERCEPQHLPADAVSEQKDPGTGHLSEPARHERADRALERTIPGDKDDAGGGEAEGEAHARKGVLQPRDPAVKWRGGWKR